MSIVDGISLFVGKTIAELLVGAAVLGCFALLFWLADRK